MKYKEGEGGPLAGTVPIGQIQRDFFTVNRTGGRNFDTLSHVMLTPESIRMIMGSRIGESSLYIDCVDRNDGRVIELKSGQMSYVDLHVNAIRGPNEGLYGAAWYWVNKEGEKAMECHGAVFANYYMFYDPNDSIDKVLNKRKDSCRFLKTILMTRGALRDAMFPDALTTKFVLDAIGVIEGRKTLDLQEGEDQMYHFRGTYNKGLLI